MCFVKYEDHVAEHKAINEKYGVDCDSLSVSEHLNYHLRYQYETGKLTKEQYNRYRGSKA